MELSSPNVSTNTVVYSGKNSPPSPKASFDYTAESSSFITYPSQAIDTSHLISKSPDRSKEISTPSKKIPQSIVAHSPFGSAEVEFEFTPTALLHAPEEDNPHEALKVSETPSTTRRNSDDSENPSESQNTSNSVEDSKPEPVVSEDSLRSENEMSQGDNLHESLEENSHDSKGHSKLINSSNMEQPEHVSLISDSLSRQASPNKLHSGNWYDLNSDSVSEKPSSAISGPVDSTRSTELEELHEGPQSYKETPQDMSLNESVTSFPSLPSSPMRKQYTDSPSHSISSHSEGTNFQDSTFFNDTRAQFDLDIDLDDHQFTGETKLSPWRKIQPRIKQTNQIFSSKRVTAQGSIAEFSSTSKIEDLSKQLTDCKIQLKLYEKFLQDLIDDDRVDINHLADFHEHFDEGAKSFSKLEREHAEICNLVEDLYSSLEEYQEKWKTADTRALDAEQSLQDVCQILNHLLDLMNLRCGAPLSDPHLFIPDASEIITNEVRNLIAEKEKMRKDRSENAQKQIDIDGKELADAKYLLSQKMAEAEKWKNESVKLKHDFDLLRLDRDNSTEMRLQNYQNKIDRLQKEIENLSEPTRKDSFSDMSDISGTSTRDREKYILLQRDYENLQRLSQDRMDELRQVREDYENKLSSMNGSLSNRKRELINLRAELAGTECLQQDLETSVGKQRVLKSENFKLSWQIDSLKKDKAELQKRITDLSERIKEMSTSEVPKEHSEAVAESHFKTLLEADVRRFERIYNSLDLLADESSLREPEQKIKRLIKMTQEIQSISKSGDTVTTIKRDHKYVFDYFVRAIDAMVKEHIRILLENSENQKEVQLKEKVKELEGTNAQLRANQLKSSEEEVSILKLRNQQLHDKWKYEREQRIHDNAQATERFQELEAEIRELRRNLAQ